MSDPDVYRRLEALGRWQDAMASVELARPIVAAYATDAGQSIPTGTGPTIVNFEDAVYDPRGLVTVGANWAFTCPIGGLYEVNAGVLFDVSAAWDINERGLLQVNRNGAFAAFLDRRANIGANNYARVQGVIPVVCVAGDTLDVRAAQNSGSSIALFTGDGGAWNYVVIRRIG